MFRAYLSELSESIAFELFMPRSGGEKGLRGSGAGTLGVPLRGTRRVGGLLGVAGASLTLYRLTNDKVILLS